MRLPAKASRTALSTITTAEFPHLYALRDSLVSMRFLEINPVAARSSNDRSGSKVLRPDASNLLRYLLTFEMKHQQKNDPMESFLTCFDGLVLLDTCR